MASRLFHVAELSVGKLLIAEERIAVHVYVCWPVGRGSGRLESRLRC